MRRMGMLCLLAVIVLTASTASSAGIRQERSFFVGGERGGKAVLYSTIIEKYLNNVVGIGAGVMGFGTDEGFVGLFPLYISLNPIGDIHSLYLSAGALIASASNWDETESTMLGTFSIGYQYQSTGGLFVRPTINMIYDTDTDGAFFVLPGFAVGGSF